MLAEIETSIHTPQEILERIFFLKGYDTKISDTLSEIFSKFVDRNDSNLHIAGPIWDDPNALVSLFSRNFKACRQLHEFL